MLLWIGFAILAAAVVGALARPLRFETRAPEAVETADAAVYRDQLAEIEADRSRDLIGEEEARSARAEVARRLLQTGARKADGPEDASREARSHASTTPMLKAALMALPLVSVAVYLALGSPLMPGRPLDGGTAVSDATPINELIAKVEQRLREAPQDGRGWEVIAPVYQRLGRYADAANAYSQALRLNGESVPLLLGFAEASLFAGNGIVSDEVRRAAERIAALDPTRMEPTVWLALGKEQDGDLAGAIADYKRLLDKGPKDDAAWREAVSARLAEVEARLAGKPSPSVAATPEAPGAAPPNAAPAAAAGPSAADMAAVQGMKPEEQAAFIESMVTRLADRLKTDGKDLAGWQKLVRAYEALGRKDEARAALAEARRNFAGDAGAEATLNGLAQSLDRGS